MASLVTRNCMKWSFFSASAFSNSSQLHFAVAFPYPNCKPQLVKEFPVVNRHKANQSNPFCCFWRSGLTTLHMYSKVGRLTRKCSFHRISNAWFLKRTGNQVCGHGHTVFFFVAFSLTTVVVVAGASTGVADVAEKFESFLEKKRGQGFVQ